MKRYLIFYFDVFNPSGGLNDFLGSTDEFDDAVKIIEDKHVDNRPDDKNYEYSNGQIYDTMENKIIKIFSFYTNEYNFIDGGFIPLSNNQILK